MKIFSSRKKTAKNLREASESGNRQISSRRNKILLLAFFFIFKFFILPWLQEKIIKYCLKGNNSAENNSGEPKQKGATLIEILIVLLIIGIISALSIFAFSRYQPSLELSSVSRDMITNLRYAQQMAISQQINYGVSFYPAQKKYQVVKLSQPEEVVKNINLPTGVDIQQVNFTSDQLKFNIYGAAVEAGSIILENQDLNTSTIEIKPSGFVKLKD